MVHDRADDHRSRHLLVRSRRGRTPRRIHRRHRPQLQAAKGRARLGQQPVGPYVAHFDPPDSLSVSTEAQMSDVPITLTCADYARVMPLATGDVKPEGIALTLILGTAGSWEMRAEMLRRALDDPMVQGGEASMAGHLRRIDRGDRSHVGLPVFPLRNFTGRDLYVRKGGPVTSPADLIGKRVGMYDWVASGSIWYRHFLSFIGVPPESLEWWIGDIDAPRATTHL